MVCLFQKQSCARKILCCWQCWQTGTLLRELDIGANIEFTLIRNRQLADLSGKGRVILPRGQERDLQYMIHLQQEDECEFTGKCQFPSQLDYRRVFSMTLEGSFDPLDGDVQLEMVWDGAGTSKIKAVLAEIGTKLEGVVVKGGGEGLTWIAKRLELD